MDINFSIVPMFAVPLIVIRIKDFTVLEGLLPPKALGLVTEWVAIHKDELLKEWELAKQQKPLFTIEPLK